MNNEKLEMQLRELKSSANAPDDFDRGLEDKILELSVNMQKKRRRARRLTACIALFLVSATGFVALGGDSVVMNYIAPSSDRDAAGNPIPYEVNWGKWLHKMHDHLWEHFHGPSNHGGPS